MKKTLIAIAAIAAMGAASAEVTLYGKMDVGASTTTNNAAGKVDQGVQIVSGAYEGSRIGVKGGSDIVAGVKGTFQLEGGVGATDGSFTGFGRVATLGLAGSFGAVTAGLQWSPYDNAFNDALEYNGFSAMSNAFAGGVHSDGGNTGNGNTKNSIQYTTPTFSGFNAVVDYANGNDNIGAGGSSYLGWGLNYANGPLAVNLATEAKKPVGAGTTVNAWLLATSYNLGMATVFVAAETADAGVATGKDTGTSVGVSVPLSKAVTAALGYATESTSLAGSSDGKTTSTGVQVVYAWNAATAIYAGYSKTDTTAVGSTATTNATKLASGVRYNF